MPWIHLIPNRRVVIDDPSTQVEIMVHQYGVGLASTSVTPEVHDRVLVLVHDDTAGESGVAQDLLDQFGIDLDLAVVADDRPCCAADGKTYRRFVAPGRVVAEKVDAACFGENAFDHLLEYACDGVRHLVPVGGVRVRRVVEDQVSHAPRVTPITIRSPR